LAFSGSSSGDKERQIRCCLENDVEFSKGSGFEEYDFINHPLPEVDFRDLDISTTFLGKVIKAPFIISPMTGGAQISRKINENLARAAQDLGIVMSVGSQKLGIEHPFLASSYQVRGVAPDVPLLANLGAIYLNYGYGLRECQQAVKMIGADGLVLYLNPLQKVLQTSNHTNFDGLVKKISLICSQLDVPVIVKEVGFGLSPSSARMLKDVVVAMLDVAGAGGTSWSKIEGYMAGNNGGRYSFDSLGTPTAESLISVLGVVGDMPVIASGGIRSGKDMAKALALGAKYVGMALPLLAPAMENAEAVSKKIEAILDEFRICMFCCGKRSLMELKEGNCLRKLI